MVPLGTSALKPVNVNSVNEALSSNTVIKSAGVMVA